MFCSFHCRDIWTQLLAALSVIGAVRQLAGLVLPGAGRRGATSGVPLWACPGSVPGSPWSGARTREGDDNSAREQPRREQPMSGAGR